MARRGHGRVLAIVAALACAAAGTLVGAAPPAAAGGPSVQIRRTEYGIPHIVAGDYRGLGYGYGYAFAQDNLCTLASRVLTLRGDRSRWFGPDADSGEPLAPATNLDSDLYYRSMLPA